MRTTSRSWFSFFVAGVLFALRPVGATDLELVTRANPISDTPVSAPGLSGIFGQTSSDDERYVVYSSISPNSSPGQIDTRPGTRDAFVWDRSTGVATLVSHAAGSPVRTSNGSSWAGKISADGRFVVFASDATDLVAGQVDIPDTYDVFVWDRNTGLVRLVNHAFGSETTVANVGTFGGSMSADGRFVVFGSEASNLLPGVTTPAVYLWDRDSGALGLISHRAGMPQTAAAGTFAATGISGDGSVVAFDSSAIDLVAGQVDDGTATDTFLWTRSTGQTVLVSRVAGTVATAAQSDSMAISLSRDGRYLAFHSFSDALVPGGDGNGTVDVFLFDRVTGTNTLVSHAAGQPNMGGDEFANFPFISADGSSVLFTSAASNLVPGQVESSPTTRDVFLWRRALDQTTLVSHRLNSNTTATFQGATAGSLSMDGRFATFSTREPDLVAGQNEPPAPLTYDAFLFDRDSGLISLASHRSGDVTTPGNAEAQGPQMSSNGSFVTYTTEATDLVAGLEDRNQAADLFLYDRTTTENRLVSGHAPGEGSVTQLIASNTQFSFSTISADGRWVAFNSISQDLAGGILRGFPYSNVFLYDRATGAQSVISRSALFPASLGWGNSEDSAINADGRFVAFMSFAFDLVPGQSEPPGFTEDVFLFDREANASVMVSHVPGEPSSASPFTHSARLPRISADGRFVAYFFSGSFVAGPDGTGYYLYDRMTGVNTLITHRPGEADVPAASEDANIPPAISADGRFVAYNSSSSELVAGVQEDPFSQDIFLYDRTTGENRLVTRLLSSPSQAAGGAALRQPVISADGRYVAYTSSSPDLAPGQAGNDVPLDDDVFLWDRDTGASRLVSHDPSGAPGDGGSELPTISADARFVAFASSASNLVPNQIDPGSSLDAFLFDRDTGGIVLASHAAGQPEKAVGGYEISEGPALSADGSRLAYSTISAEPVVAGQSGPGGIFVYDRATGTNLLASHRPGDATRPGNSSLAFVRSISADGSAVAFALKADDLVAHDYNQGYDVFVHATSTAPATGAYFTVPPCRLLDTRAAGQTPALASAAIRALTVSGRCAVPASAKAIAVTLTVTGGTGLGFLSLFPANLPPPATAALNFAANQTRSSNAIASLATNGAGTLGLSAFVSGGGTVEAIVDVFGYFE